MTTTIKSRMATNYVHKDELAMAWLNLSYVPKGLFDSNPKPILVSLSGRINFHTLTALMGPSGAGKTTLLKCINMRNSEGLTSDTKIYVNKYTPLRTCFIMQDSSEHLFMGLTVRESLLFASKIKNRKPVRYQDSYAQTGPSLLDLDSEETTSVAPNVEDFEPMFNSNGKFDHNRNIDRILSELLLQDCSSNRVNDCSGGEQKRLSIALELVSELKPNLLCIDEPTSGLDSNASEMVIQCLRSLSCVHRMSIVTSIHQPNSLLLNMFDQLYVMSKGGHCVFTGRPNTLRTYLSDNQIQCPEDVLPIELLLKISSKFPKQRVKSLINYINNNISDAELCVEMISNDTQKSGNEIDRLIKSSYKNFSDIEEECHTSGRLVSGVITQTSHLFNVYHFWHLLHRAYTCFIRFDWKISFALALFSLLVSGAIIHLYGTEVGVEDGCVDRNASAKEAFEKAIRLMNPESNINMNLKCQFFVVIFLQFVTSMCTILVFPQEVRIFITEHHNRWYSTSSYFWSKCTLEVPVSLVISLIYSAAMYFGTGQYNEGNRFIYYYAIIFIGMVCSSSMGYFCGVLFAKNVQIAVTMGVVMIMCLVLVSGFFVPWDLLDPVLKTLSFGSYCKLTFESMLIIVYGLNRCDPNSDPILLKQMNLNDNNILVTNAWYLLGNIIFWRLIAMSGLIYRANDFGLTKMFHRKQKLKSIVN